MSDLSPAIAEELQLRALIANEINAVLDGVFIFEKGAKCRISEPLEVVCDTLNFTKSNIMAALIREEILLRGAQKVRLRGLYYYRGIRKLAPQ